jgi:hypothetical protein
MGAPVCGQTGLVMAFFLERQQQKLGDGVGGKLHVQNTRRRGDVIDVLIKLIGERKKFKIFLTRWKTLYIVPSKMNDDSFILTDDYFAKGTAHALQNSR